MATKTKPDAQAAAVYADYAGQEAAADAAPVESSVNISVRVPARLAARLRYRAGIEHVSVSELIRRLLDERHQETFTPAQEKRIEQLALQVLTHATASPIKDGSTAST